jgi:hypothetical protein
MKGTNTPQKLSPHYSNENLLINVGVYGKKSTFPLNAIKVNKEAESFVKKLGGRKMLYAHAYYDEGEFWRIYDKHWYNDIRSQYNAEGVFASIYDVVKVEGITRPTIFKGILKLLWMLIRMKDMSV